MATFGDQWDVWAGEDDERPTITRVRMHARQLVEPARYPTILRISWEFEPADESGLPDPELNFQMGEFEDLVIPELERNWLCIFYCINLQDGEKTWSAYTCNTREAIARLDRVMENCDPVPVSVSETEDPEWIEYFALGEGKEVEESDMERLEVFLNRLMGVTDEPQRSWRENVLKAVLIAVPLVAWALHIGWLMPRLDELTGDAAFILAGRFFLIFGLAMVICEVAAVVRLARAWSWWTAAAAALNLTPLYYVKVMLWGV